MKKMLIVYYSWSNGNTARIAKELQSATGADLARIDTVKPYPTDYQATVDQGEREVTNGYQPEIQPLKVDVQDYDVIAVGTPTWWYTMAPAVLTFLNSQNWKGKTVIPFMTNGGWPGHVIRDMNEACAGAKVKLPMQVKFDSNGGDQLETPQIQINQWTASVAALCSAG
ncbi:MAG: NAD(P)H-dependent oxidoreductase [Clostridiales bacterium]|nr:NAD(P)H-dependent oxidoreductase [Clostridiales bacterium]